MSATDSVRPAPTAPSARIESLDVVRGVALLGILLLNILYGLPGLSYFTPVADNALGGINFAAFVTVETLFEGVMRGLFSMLFGAGVALFADGRGAGPYYRRQALLLGFGVFNALVLMFAGDILVTYALAGFILYFARKWRPCTLLIVAGVVYLWLGLVYSGLFSAASYLDQRADADQASEAAPPPSAAPMEDALSFLDPSPEELQNELAAHTAPYAEAFVANLDEVVGMWLAALPWTLFWDALACMLVGMALYRTGVLRGTKSERFYVRLGAWGVAIGLTVNALEVAMRVSNDFGLAWSPMITTPTYDIGRVATALGYIGLVMLVCQRGWLPRVRRALSAVGRMALTNYLMHSLFFLLIFHHSVGLGLWNRLERAELYLVVFAIWAFQIAFSLWWMGRYRFGPMEWLWRVLTYGRLPRSGR